MTTVFINYTAQKLLSMYHVCILTCTQLHTGTNTHECIDYIYNLSQLKEVTNRVLRWRKIKIAPQSRKAGRYGFFFFGGGGGGRNSLRLDLT